MLRAYSQCLEGDWRRLYMDSRRCAFAMALSKSLKWEVVCWRDWIFGYQHICLWLNPSDGLHPIYSISPFPVQSCTEVSIYSELPERRTRECHAVNAVHQVNSITTPVHTVGSINSDPFASPPSSVSRSRSSPPFSSAVRLAFLLYSSSIPVFVSRWAKGLKLKWN